MQDLPKKMTCFGQIVGKSSDPKRGFVPSSTPMSATFVLIEKTD
jgi:hypothetical protein